MNKKIKEEILFCKYFSKNPEHSFNQFIVFSDEIIKNYNQVRTIAERLKRKNILISKPYNDSNGYRASLKHISEMWEKILL